MERQVSLKCCLWVGRFDSSSACFPEPVKPITRTAFDGVLLRFGDRDDIGSLLRGGACSKDGKKSIMGYVNGEYIIFRQPGFIEVNLGMTDPKMDQFLGALVAELDCVIFARDGGDWWTERFVRVPQ